MKINKRLKKQFNLTSKKLGLLYVTSVSFVVTNHRDYKIYFGRGNTEIGYIYFHPFAKEYCIAILDNIALTEETVKWLSKIQHNCNDKRTTFFRTLRRQYFSKQRFMKTVTWTTQLEMRRK